MNLLFLRLGPNFAFYDRSCVPKHTMLRVHLAKKIVVEEVS